MTQNLDVHTRHGPRSDSIHLKDSETRPILTGDTLELPSMNLSLYLPPFLPTCILGPLQVNKVRVKKKYCFACDKSFVVLFV